MTTHPSAREKKIGQNGKMKFVKKSVKGVGEITTLVTVNAFV